MECTRCKNEDTKTEKRPSTVFLQVHLFMHNKVWRYIARLADFLVETVMHLDLNNMMQISEDPSACEVSHKLL